MKIETELVSESSIEEFADTHNLTMQIKERGKDRMRDVSKFYARFKNAEISEGSMLIGAHGNGETPEEAIADYAREDVPGAHNGLVAGEFSFGDLRQMLFSLKSHEDILKKYQP